MVATIRSRKSLIGRIAGLTLAAALFVAVTSVAAQAQTIYFNLGPQPVPPTSQCSTVYFMNGDGTMSSTVQCSPYYDYYTYPTYYYYYYGY